ncbi:MAG: DUF721 domain-containing protein [Candidatus Omnitrophota bacterium]
MDRVQDIVKQVMNDLGQKKTAPQDRIMVLWPSICEKKAAKHTSVTGLHKGELLVCVDAPAWLFQMSLQKTKLLKAIKAQIPEITGIRFKIGKVK